VSRSETKLKARAVQRTRDLFLPPIASTTIAPTSGTAVRVVIQGKEVIF
jgi:hypothetical protein